MVNPKIKEIVKKDELGKAFKIYDESDYLVIFSYINQDEKSKKETTLQWDSFSKRYVIRLKENPSRAFEENLGVSLSRNRCRFSDLTNPPLIKKMVEKYFQDVVNYAQNNEFIKFPFLYITGVNLSGKTYLMDSIANELLEKQIEITYIPYRELVRIYKSFSRQDDFESQIEHLKNCKVLFIDDLMSLTQLASGCLVGEVLIPILEYRRNNHSPVIFTSNYTIREVGELRFEDAEEGIRFQARLMEATSVIVDRTRRVEDVKHA